MTPAEIDAQMQRASDLYWEDMISACASELAIQRIARALAEAVAQARAESAAEIASLKSELNRLRGVVE